MTKQFRRDNRSTDRNKSDVRASRDRNTDRNKSDVRTSRDRDRSEIRDARVVDRAKSDMRDNRVVDNKVVEVREDLIEGRNAVIELLKSDRTIEYILVAKGDREGSINKIITIAKDKGIVIKEADRKKLDTMTNFGAHQGVVAIVTPYKYSEVEDILELAKKRGEDPFIVILDEIEDPHNLGSIVRTAELCGVHGVIIPKRRNVGITPTVYKTSVGAVEHIKIAKVTNINSTIDLLKESGIWVYGADMDGEQYSYEADFKGGVALVIGNEGKGISKLTKSKCDCIVKIPMVGKINSLNASVAGGILMYEILKSKMK